MCAVLAVSGGEEIGPWSGVGVSGEVAANGRGHGHRSSLNDVQITVPSGISLGYRVASPAQSRRAQGQM